jgi:hypothetical protein
MTFERMWVTKLLGTATHPPEPAMRGRRCSSAGVIHRLPVYIFINRLAWKNMQNNPSR